MHARPSRTSLAVLALAASGVALVTIGTGGSAGHRLSVTVPQATGVIVGQELRVAGQAIGSITRVSAVRRGDAVTIGMRIDDEAWPLPRGTRMALRTGGTVTFGNRYVAVLRPAGPVRGELRDGERLPAAHFSVPVEFDEFIGTFTSDVRRDLKRMLDQGGVNLSATAPALRRALVDAPATTRQLGAVFGDLAGEHEALGSLVRTTARVTAAVDHADPGLRTLLSGAGTTFDVLATDAAAVQRTLDVAPRVLTHARSTLRRADGTLAAVREVTGRLAPGVTQLRRTTGPLDRVLATVVDVAPDARRTLRSLRSATPQLNPLLSAATTIAPQLGSIGRQATDALKCIRPYTPDMMSFFSTWGDSLVSGDGRDKYFRATVQALLPAPTNVSGESSADAVKAFPGTRYGFPRPPGYNAGQPWFLPECGAGPDALDPAKDPESRSFNPLMRLPADVTPKRKAAK